MTHTSKLVALARCWGMLLFGVLFTCTLEAQRDSISQKLSFTGDFRFRIEHDWNSRKADGNMRADRSRLRYRFRFGMHYQLDEHSSFGGRIRTGNIDDQQGPHLTLGGGNGEFGLEQIGLEKLYYQFKLKKWSGWIGKNTINLHKENELFWNDNVFPAGGALRYEHPLGNVNAGSQIKVNLGHFIIRSNNETFSKDAYLQFAQLHTQHLQGKLHFFPALYRFQNIDDLPDRKGTYQLDYSILHLAGSVQLLDQPRLTLTTEYYTNSQDYTQHESIPEQLCEETNGWVVSAKLGRLKRKGDWLLHAYYAHLGKFSIVDYFAQNDWARWDYSSAGATGSRLSNFQGVEVRVGYVIKEKFNLILRSYFVEQLVSEGDFLENGSRIRLDLNIGF